MSQGAALQHAELIEQEVRVIVSEVEMPVPGGTFLIAMGRADRIAHVLQHVLKPIAVVKPVEPLRVQVGQRGTVLGQSQRLDLEPPLLQG